MEIRMKPEYCKTQLESGRLEAEARQGLLLDCLKSGLRQGDGEFIKDGLNVNLVDSKSMALEPQMSPVAADREQKSEPPGENTAPKTSFQPSRIDAEILPGKSER